MTKQLKVVSVTKEIHQETNSYFLDVSVELSTIDADGEVVATESKKYAYPFGSTAEEIKAELAKTLNLAISEDQDKILNAETERLNKQADETIADLDGFESNSEYELPEAPAEAGEGEQS